MQGASLPVRSDGTALDLERLILPAQFLFRPGLDLSLFAERGVTTPGGRQTPSANKFDTKSPIWFRLALRSTVNAALMKAVATKDGEQSTAEDALRLVVDTTPALIHTGRPDGYLDYFNQRWLDFLGCSLEEVCGWRWTDSIHPEDVAGIVQKWHAALTSGEPFEAEARVRRADGEYRLLLHRKLPLRDEQGAIIKWFGSSVDIEDRKRVEEAMLQKEKDLQELIDAVPQHIGVASSDGRPLFVNKAALEYHGLTRDEWFDAAAPDVTRNKIAHPDDLERVLRAHTEGILSGKPYGFEVRLRRKDGEYRRFLFRSNPHRDDRGHVVRWYSTRTDIEDLKRAEDALRLSEAYMAQAQQVARLGSWAYKPPGVREYLSDEYFRMVGFDPARAHPTDQELFALVHPEDRQRTEEAVAQFFKCGQVLDVKFRILRTDGQLRVVRDRGVAVVENGVIVRFVGVCLDITEEEQRIDQLRLSEAFMAQAQQLARVGSWSYKPSGECEHWSEETLRIYGFEPAQKLPTFGEGNSLVHPDDRKRIAEESAQLFENGRELDIKYRFIRADGQVRVIRDRGIAIRENGVITRFVGASLDITEEETLTQELHRREAYLAQAQSISRTGSFGWNLSSGELYWSDETFDILGYKRTVKPTLELVFARVHPEDLGLVRETLGRASQNGKAFDFEHRLLLPNGSVKHVHVIARPFKDESGNVELVGSVMDVTARQKAFQEIEALKDELYKENIVLREEVGKASMFEEVIGTSPVLQTVLARAAKVAPTDSTVLILGETGTGKELIARAIHKRSKRSERAFVGVNCSAIPSSLITSELFGHEKGAFTGAVQRRLGRFELAEGGTLFLDEIGELPLETQISLLRVLQEREFERVGGTEILQSDVRVIAATNRDLQAAIAAGAFRNDLFYRLNVFPIKLPPLRERNEDIPPLVNYFVDRFAKRAGRKIKGIRKRTLELLQAYSWPGNVRELQNVIERSLIVCETSEFSVDKSWLSSEQPAPTASQAPAEQVLTERELIETTLAQTKGKVSGAAGAAAKLGMPASTLEWKIRTLKIDKFRFKQR